LGNKYTLFTTGIGFLIAWLIFTAIAWSANDEPPKPWVYSVIALPLAQAVIFAIYRSDPRQRIIGGMILAIMAATLALNFATNVGGFAGYFLIVSFASAVLHAFYGFLVNTESKPEKHGGGAPLGKPSQLG
jgi:hypothetical protein